MMLFIYGVMTVATGTLGMFFGIFACLFAPFLQWREESKATEEKMKHIRARAAKAEEAERKKWSR